MRSSYAREVARLRRARSFGLQWRAYAQLVGGILVLVLVAAVVPEFPLEGVIVGVLLGASLMLLLLSVHRFDDPLVRGQLAEEWTGATMKRVRGWNLVGNLRFENADVDHVVITPRAVLAVETKYHGAIPAGSVAETERVGRDLHAAVAAADKVRSFLRANRLHTTAEVFAVLVVWGAGAPRLDGGYRLTKGVYVVDGDHPDLWTHCFNGPILTTEIRQTLADAFDDFAYQRERYVAEHQPWIGSRLWDEVKDGVATERVNRSSAKAGARALRRRHAIT